MIILSAGQAQKGEPIMASYTIEDIELIRRKSGISYQEAVALLDYHNGNVARALVDLERNGRIKPENTQRPQTSMPENNKKGFANFMTRLYQFRLKVKKGPVTILNLSLLFSLLAVIISPHLVIIGAMLMLILGYHVSFDKHDTDFASENLERMVRNASENVKETVSDFTKGFESAFSDDASKARETNAQPVKQVDRGPYEEILHQAGETVRKTVNDVARSLDSAFSGSSTQAEKQVESAEQSSADADRSFYTSNPAAASQHRAYNPASTVPTIQVPVQVESQDGSVQLKSDSDGYHSATIE